MVESLEIYWHVVYCTKFHKVKHPQNILKFNYGKRQAWVVQVCKCSRRLSAYSEGPISQMPGTDVPAWEPICPPISHFFPHDLCPTQHSHSVFVGNFHFMSNIHYISYGRVAKAGKRARYWIFQRLIAISILGNSKWWYCSSNMV